MLDAIQRRMLEEIADLHNMPEGAYNIRANGVSAARCTTANIDIQSKKDNPGIDIFIKPGTKNESVHIPVILSESGLKETVYNDFYIGEDSDVTIIAGCGIHTETGEPARHSGIHRFFLEKGASVRYVEKHIGTGANDTKKVIDPQTEVYLGPDSYLEMDTVQLGGVSSSVRKTRGTVGDRATLIIKERLLTDGDETATTDFEVEMNGEDSGVNLISRSVARGNSYQAYRSNIIGNAKCTGHSECDAILSENGRVDASPELVANNRDAALIHEAAIGKIAGEQILKLRTLGLTEEEAEKAIIDGFLK